MKVKKVDILILAIKFFVEGFEDIEADGCKNKILCLVIFAIPKTHKSSVILAHISFTCNNASTAAEGQNEFSFPCCATVKVTSQV